MPIQMIQPRPLRADTTVFAPGLRITSDMDLLFLSGITARPLNLGPSEPWDYPEDIGEQTRMMMENIQSVLDEAGITWREVIKIVKFYTERGGGAIEDEYLQGWTPCSTSLGVTGLPIPGAKVMYDVTAVVSNS